MNSDQRNQFNNYPQHSPESPSQKEQNGRGRVSADGNNKVDSISMPRKKTVSSSEDRTASRRMQVAKKEFRRRVSGKPTRHTGMVSVFKVAGNALRHLFTAVIVLILIASFLLGGLGFGMLSGYIATATPVEIADIKSSSEPTYVYDRNGNEIASFTGSSNFQREYVQIATIKPTWLNDAFIAIEDERYETHQGIDPRRIGSAVFSMLVNAGTPTHGGSTISQQVVKMLSGANEESAQRKVQEWYRAIELEKVKSKDEIMELYCNLVPMANNYLGVQSAAKAYFGKDISDLSLAECAFLAGIPNLPSIYNPRTESGRRNAQRRMRIVLQNMLDQEMISKEEHEAALNEELIFVTDESSRQSSNINSYFVDAVIQQIIQDLQSRRGYSLTLARLAVYQQGLRIETTMDPKVQDALTKTFQKSELFSSNPEALPDIPEPPQAAMTVISNMPSQRGQVVGLYGGFGEKTTAMGWNRATQNKRQPGSSIKPILVYAPAIEIGAATAGTVMMDEAKHLDPQNPEKEWPQNVTKSYSGARTLRDALKYSINTIAVDLYVNQVTPQVGLSYLRALGIDRHEETQPAGAIGAFGEGVNTYEMAGAYSVFANQGVYVEPYMYTKVLDQDGRVLLENKPEIRQVFTPETAYIVTDILQDAVETVFWFAPGRLDDQVSAGKTGTTDNIIDTWYCGYTPYYTGAVWYGYDNNNGRRTSVPEVDRYNGIGIWADVMNQIHKGKESAEFERPANVVSRTICATTGLLANPYCEETTTEIFDRSRSNFPTYTCDLHQAPPPETEPTDDTPDTEVPTETKTPDPDPTETATPTEVPVTPPEEDSDP